MIRNEYLKNFAGQIPHENCGLRALNMALPKGGMLVLSDEFDVLAKNSMTPGAAAEGSLLLRSCLFFKWLNRNSTRGNLVMELVSSLPGLS